MEFYKCLYSRTLKLSTIFTKNPEGQLNFLGRSGVEYGDAYRSGGLRGILGLFGAGSKGAISDLQEQQFNIFADEYVTKEASIADAAAKTEQVIGSLDQSIVNFAESTDKAQFNLKNFEQYMKAAPPPLEKFAAKLKTAAYNMAAMFIIIGTIKIAINIFDQIANRVEYAREALEKSNDTYEEGAEKLKDLQAQLDETSTKMAELESGGITVIEQSEYDKLVATNEELERNITLQKIANQSAIKQSAEDAVDFYNKKVGNREPASMDKIQENVNSNMNWEVGQFLGNIDRKDINSMLGAYVSLQKVISDTKTEMDTLLEASDEASKSRLTYLQEQLEIYQQHLNDAASAISTESKDYQMIFDSLQGKIDADLSLSFDEQQVYDAVDSALDLIARLIDDPKVQIDNFIEENGLTADITNLVNSEKGLSAINDELASNYPELLELMQQCGFTVADLAAQYSTASDALSKLRDTEKESFNFDDYSEQFDEIQSSVSTLRSALNSLNSGELDSNTVIDLMQQFPELIPYINLTADGFGNLSEGLHQLIDSKPTELIASLYELRDAANTDEERQQINALINSLQELGTYGDTGAEAYATAIGATWDDTAAVINGVSAQFENLAKVQEAVADGMTMSATAAAELAQIYPEILTNAETTADGQITLNEEVVKSILAGKTAAIDSQITQLEADKAVLNSKKAFAEAQLQMLQQVGEGEGQMELETAAYKINLANQVVQEMIEAGNSESEAYAQAVTIMSTNTDTLNQNVATASGDMQTNMLNAFSSMAKGASDSSVSMQKSFSGIIQKVKDTIAAVRALWSNEDVSISGGEIYETGSGINQNPIDAITRGSKAVTNDFIWNPDEVSLDDFQEKLKLDIKGYEDAISNIDTQISILKNLQSTFTDTVNSANGGIGDHNYADKIADLEKEKQSINEALDKAKGIDTDRASQSAKETEDTYEELFDFFERRVKVLDDAVSLLNAHLDNVIGADAKNTLIDAEYGVLEERYKNYSDALNMYQEMANRSLANLDADMQSKIQSGSVSITDFIGKGNEDVVEALKDYEKWADKVADCKQELAELKEEIRQLELDKFNNIIEDFTNQFDIYGDSIDLINKQIDLFKEAGQVIGESFYSKQIEQSQKQLNTLEREKTKLIDQLNSSLTSGRVEVGTDEWLEMANALSEVDGQILDCKKSIEELDNAILELHWEMFDRIQSAFDGINSEIDGVLGLLDNVDVSDVNGHWSDEGITQLGLYAQQYELAEYQIRQYNDAINELNSQYLQGKYSATEYMDKLAELKQEQWDAVEASEAAKDSIVDLNEARIDIMVKGIEEEIDKYKELIDAQKDALESRKELEDYKKSVQEKSRDIQDLERQIAAMMGDTSAATTAKRKLKEQELADLRMELDDYENEHNYEQQQEALDRDLEQFTDEKNQEIEALQASLEQREVLIAQSFENVKANAATVAQELEILAQTHGIQIDSCLTSAWQSGENAIASYGIALDAGTSQFIGNIIGVENQVWQLQNDADVTAASLSNMFATRADVLVGELQSSYYGESNLQAMTNALHDSLIQTLEGGYDISSISNALNGIAEGAYKVASAANEASAALASMGAAQQAAANQVAEQQSIQKSVQRAAEEAAKRSTGGRTELMLKNRVNSFYASGTRNARGGINITDEEGYELKLPRVGRGKYTITTPGTQILTAKQTDNLFALAQIDPKQLLANSKFNTGDIVKGLDKALDKIGLPTAQPALNVNVGTLMNVEKVDSTNIQQMQAIADKAIDNLGKHLVKQLKYGGA